MKISLLDFAQKDDPYACTNYEDFEEQPDEFLVSSDDHLSIVGEKARKLAMVVLHNRSVAAAIGAADVSAEEAALLHCTASQKRIYKIWKTCGEMPEMTWTGGDDHQSKRQRTNETDQDGEEETPITMCWALAELYRLPSSEKSRVTRKDVQSFCSQYTRMRPLLDVMHSIVRLRCGADDSGDSVTQQRRANEQEATVRAIEAIEKQYATIKAEAQKHFDDVEESLEVIRERIGATQKDATPPLPASSPHMQIEDAHVVATGEEQAVAAEASADGGNNDPAGGYETQQTHAEVRRAGRVSPQQKHGESQSYLTSTAMSDGEVAETSGASVAMTETQKDFHVQEERNDQLEDHTNHGLSECGENLTEERFSVLDDDDDRIFADLFSSPINDDQDAGKNSKTGPTVAQMEAEQPILENKEDPNAPSSSTSQAEASDARATEVEEGDYTQHSESSATPAPLLGAVHGNRDAPLFSSLFSQSSAKAGLSIAKRSFGTAFNQNSGFPTPGSTSSGSNMPPPPIPVTKPFTHRVLFPASQQKVADDCNSSAFSLPSSQHKSLAASKENAGGYDRQSTDKVAEYRGSSIFHSYDNLPTFS